MNGAWRRWPSALMTAALAVAVISARPYAGGWNDGSRLATVERLVDRHTFVIDDSIFVRSVSSPSPYQGEGRGEVTDALSLRPPPDLLVGREGEHGTQDKLLIDGHFYSDKPPLSAVLLAGLYQLLQSTTGLNARDHPGRFCYVMSFFGAGVPYLAAVWSMVRIAAQLALPRALQVLLPASFAFATVAPAYARHVNGHIQLLAVAAIVYCLLLHFAGTASSAQRTGTALVIGAALGLAYALDLAAGPLLLASTLVLVATRAGRRAAVICAIGAVPGVVFHHGLTYAIAGTLLPANMYPAYFQWPGAPFDPTTMTGSWHHTPLGLAGYALALLFGRRGFLIHNLPLLILIPAVVLSRLPLRERPEAVHALCWSAATWLAYAMGSTNYSGACLSIRWFVPLLVPGYVLIALLLRAQPHQRASFALLSAWGLLLASIMWRHGPWIGRQVPFLWPLVGAALASWVALRIRTQQREKAPNSAGGRNEKQETANRRQEMGN